MPIDVKLIALGINLSKKNQLIFLIIMKLWQKKDGGAIFFEPNKLEIYRE